MKNIIIKDLGLINYQNCWDLQEKIHKSIIDTKRENKKKTQKIICCYANILMFSH